MNCGKPLCMFCVSERGYYCSDTCKAAVQATEPDAPRDERLDQLDAQLQRSRAVLTTLWRKLALVLVLILVLGAGWLTYRLLFAPRGKITVAFPVDSAMASFFAQPLDADTVLVRANNELFRLRLRTQTKLWSVTLPEDESGSVVSVHGSEIQIRYRDRVQSLDAQTGTPLREATRPPQSQHEWNQHTITIRPAALKPQTESQEEPELTAGDPEQFSARRLFNLAGGEQPSAPPREFQVRFSGATPAELTLAFSEWPTVFPFEKSLVLVGGRHLAVFDRIGEPRWQHQLDAEFVTLTVNDNALAVATLQSVTLLDLHTGQQRWRATDLQTENLTLAPDGSVYAFVVLSSEQAKAHEKQFRAAPVAPRGLGITVRDAVPALLKLDARDGSIRWGVRNIGQYVLVTDDSLFVADDTDRVNLLAPAGIIETYYSIRQLNPRTGADLWHIIDKGSLADAHLLGRSPLLVVLPHPPAGRINPTGSYRLQLVETN